jgi:hypothetical protein
VKIVAGQVIAGVVELVDGQDNPTTYPPQLTRYRGIDLGRPQARINEVQYYISVFDRDFRLQSYRGGQTATSRWLHASCIDQQELPPSPLGPVVRTVAGGPSSLGHNRLPSPENSIEERTFSHVRRSDYGYNR